MPTCPVCEQPVDTGDAYCRRCGAALEQANEGQSAAFRELVAEYRTRAADNPDDDDAHYGLGWRIYDYAGTTIVYHGGWVQGFRAEMGFIPQQKVGIVVLLNCESMVANLFLPSFFDLYLNLSESDSLGINN